MTSTYISRFIIPGRRAGNIKQLVQNDGNSRDCACPVVINNKIIKNSNPDVIPAYTQKDRAVNAIRYATGGRVVFGNPPYNSSGISVAGAYETIVQNYQPPIRNKF